MNTRRADRDAGEPRGVGVRADRVQLAARPERAQVVRADADDDRDDDREDRDPGDRLLRDLEERVRQRARDDLAAADDQHVDAADDVEHRERHDEARDAADDGERGRSTTPQAMPIPSADEEDDGDRDARVLCRTGRPRGTPTGPSTEPTDRSTFRVSTTIVSPIASSAKIVVSIEDELDVRQVEEARLDARRDEHEQQRARRRCRTPAAGRRGRRAGAARAGERARGSGAGSTSRAHARRHLELAGRGRDDRSSDASACANSATSRPSRMTRMRSASRSTSGSSDEIIRIATPSAASSLEQPVHLGLRADVDAARRLVDDQQRRPPRRATSRARPSAGCRPRASVIGIGEPAVLDLQPRRPVAREAALGRGCG